MSSQVKYLKYRRVKVHRLSSRGCRSGNAVWGFICRHAWTLWVALGLWGVGFGVYHLLRWFAG